MRILIVVPRQDAATGNRVTGERFRRGLSALGHHTVLVETPLEAGPLAASLAALRPEVAVLLHAWRSGRPWLEVSGSSAVPSVVLLTGTDVHGGLDDPVQGPVIEAVLRGAAAVLTQNRLTAEELRRTRPDLAGRLHHLPPGIELGSAPCPHDVRRGLVGDTCLFLCPAGLRPVKGLLELIDLCDPLAARFPFRLSFCGPSLDPAYSRRLMAAIETHPWASYLGVIPPESMPAALLEADVVVSNAFAEGLPNVLVEAAALGRPILARDIPGNAAVVVDGVNGLLYRDAEGFSRTAGRLLTEPGLIASLHHPDPGRFNPVREVEQLAAICAATSAGR